MAGFLSNSFSVTQFSTGGPIPQELQGQIPVKLKTLSFRDADDDPSSVVSWGWTNFDDLLDTEWAVSSPQKGFFFAFSFRIDERRVAPALLKKHLRLRMDKELEDLKSRGKRFISRERKKEIREEVMLRLRARAMPIPQDHQVIWDSRNGHVYLATTKRKVIELFTKYFTRTFQVELQEITPDVVASDFAITDEQKDALANFEPTPFFGSEARRTVDEMGQDFLTWLWFSTQHGGTFVAPDGKPFAASLERKIIVESEVGENKKTATVSGPLSALEEAMTGLRLGKKVVSAGLFLEQGDGSWLFTVQSLNFRLNSCRTPKGFADESEDPEGFFLDKAGFVIRAFEMLHAIFRAFLLLRLSDNWDVAVNQLRDWVNASAEKL